MKKPWFRKKIFGWGLSPATWQGWLATLGLATVAVLDFYFISPGFWSDVVLFVSLVVFILTAVFTGEEPGTHS